MFIQAIFMFIHRYTLRVQFKKKYAKTQLETTNTKIELVLVPYIQFSILCLRTLCSHMSEAHLTFHNRNPFHFIACLGLRPFVSLPFVLDRGFYILIWYSVSLSIPDVAICEINPLFCNKIQTHNFVIR